MGTNPENRAEEGVATDARLPRWFVPVILFVALFVLFGMTATRQLTSADDHAAAVESWRIASSGSPWLEGVLDKHIHANPWVHKVPNGHVVADRMAGPVVVSVPFYWLLGRGPATTDFEMWPSGIGASFATAWTVVLMFLALRPRLGQKLAATVSLCFGLTTPTWTVSADGPWTHTVTQLGLAGAAYAASRGSWWWAGGCLGVSILGRPHLAVAAAILGLGMAWSRRSVRPAVQVGVPSLLALALLLVWNRVMFGVWAVVSAGYVGHVGYLVDGMDGIDGAGAFGNYLGFLVSPARGFLVWTPVLLVLLPALLRAWGTLPAWTKWFALAGVGYTALQLRLDTFDGGQYFYAYRHGLELLTCLTPLFAFSLPHVGRVARVVAPLVLSVQFGAILLGAAVDGYFVAAQHAWTDNGLLMALRRNPDVVGPWMALCVVLGLLGAYLANRRPRTSSEEAPGYRRPLEPVD
jgi:alpha-1,2-mannosyltransferase